MGLASLFATRPPAVRIKFRSDALLEPTGRFPKTLDQGLSAVHFGESRLDVPQPTQIGLAGLVAQSQLGIFQFPK